MSKTPPDKKTQSTKSTTGKKLYDYRVAAYEQMGFTKYQSATLADIPGLFCVSVRETYIDKGCSVELAWRILRP